MSCDLGIGANFGLWTVMARSGSNMALPECGIDEHVPGCRHFKETP